MAKSKKEIVYFCSECGYESSKWLGQCPSCKSWNTFVEQKIGNDSIQGLDIVRDIKKTPKTLADIKLEDIERYKTNIGEFDNLLGGGIVKGSLSLIGGAPGIGKSTLLLQICKALGDSGKTVLYVSGEENLPQIKLRANRIGTFNDNVTFLDEVNLQKVLSSVLDKKPDFLVIDSIQTMHNGDSEQVPGSINQVRICSQILFRIAKEENITTFVIGHITKDGQVAGPKILEHIVDTVLYFEDDTLKNLRLLRCYKNRFGKSTNLAIFSMEKEGLKEIINPSLMFLDGRPSDKSGCVLTCIVDSLKPIMIEVQALVTKSNLSMARRATSGYDYTKLSLLIAIIEKRLNIPLYEYDIYVNVTGGLKLKDTSIDLAIIMAILSSYKNVSIGSDCIYVGEVGLSGEVRSIPNVDIRIAEAMKLGYKRIFIPKVNLDNIDVNNYKNIVIKPVGDIIS